MFTKEHGKIFLIVLVSTMTALAIHQVIVAKHLAPKKAGVPA